MYPWPIPVIPEQEDLDIALWLTEHSRVNIFQATAWLKTFMTCIKIGCPYNEPACKMQSWSIVAKAQSLAALAKPGTTMSSLTAEYMLPSLAEQITADNSTALTAPPQASMSEVVVVCPSTTTSASLLQPMATGTSSLEDVPMSYDEDAITEELYH